LHYVKLETNQFTDEVELRDEDVKAYYEAHSEELRVPDRVEIEYVLFPNDHFEPQVTLTEADARKYYDDNQKEFEQQEQVRARHILIRSPESAGEETKAEARQRAEAALTRVKDGADFATVATEVSEDSSASNGGDLGFFRRGMMVPPFEEAAFSLQPGQTSDIVETQFGFHIIKVEERKEAGVLPFEEKRAQIEDKLRAQRARDLVRDRANQAHVDASAGKSLAEIAAAYQLEMKTAGPLAKTDQVGGISGTALSNAAVSLEQAGIGPIVTVPDGGVLFRVTAKIPSHVPELTAIRAQVEEALRKEKATELAKKAADEMLAAAQEKGLRPAAEERALQLQESGPFGRSDATPGSIGAAAELKKQAFHLTIEKPVAPAVYDVDGAYVVAALHQRFPADMSVFDQQKQQLIESTETRYKNEVLTKLVTQLRTDASIYVGRGYETGETATL
jgi:peptidyl-prolyl cis-trans isomerase D